MSDATTEQTAIQTRPASPMERVKNYMLSPEVKERFTDMMGPDGNYYLNQVMMVVAASEDLQKCEPASILISAIRAATLKLSVDPTSGQAWIIPYNGKATFQIGYKGVYDMAMRTNRYRYINVSKIYEGEDLVEDRLTGMHSLHGAKKSDTVIGWLLYFELVDGFKKTFYMTIPEITAHAEHYSKAYRNPKSKWNDKYERWKMERKTVIINGLRQFGVFNPGDKAMLDSIESDQEWHDNDLPEEGEVTVVEEEKKSMAQLQASIGVDPEPAQEPTPEPKKYDRPLSPEDLKHLIEKKAEGYAKKTVNEKQIGLTASMMEWAFAGQQHADKIRHSITKYLTGVTSMKEVPQPMVHALLDWLKPVQDSGGEYIPDAMAVTEIKSVWTAALKAEGQGELPL